MENNRIVWFLGSNSEHGFHSLYDGFCAGDGDFLRVIKGGPGTGKSSFMRAIGRAAEEAGHEVEYILCSGDPDSLDGVYISDLHTGYADGTAPHILDPAVFGADGDYLNIGEHCSTGGTFSRRGELRDLNAGYKVWYRRAYELLAAAARVSPSLTMSCTTDSERAAARSRADGVASRELAKAPAGEISLRFLGGLTCSGRVMATDTLARLCPRLHLLDNRLGLGFEFTERLARRARERRLGAVICPHWLRPDRTEAVLFPSIGVGWAVTDPLAAYPEQHRRIHLDRMVSSETLRALRQKLREDEKCEEQLLRRAGECLAAAKAIHDELEAVYHPYVDFDALTKAAEAEKRRLGL